MRSKIAFSMVLALAVLAALGVMAGGGVDIDWNVLAGGGGRVTAGSYSLDNTVGQATTGLASSGSPGLCAGFWCREEVNYRVYLPLVLIRYRQ